MNIPVTDDMLHVVKWHNGEKEFSPFSDAEMTRRQDSVRGWMAENKVDAALFTSYHCINYYSGWLYCYFGRKYGMVIDHDKATTISAGIDGGQPWRRSFGDNVTYTDWRRDNFYRAVRQLTAGAKRIGIEFDHVTLDFRRQLEEALPGVEFVDIGQPSMWMRTIKSAEEQKLIRERTHQRTPVFREGLWGGRRAIIIRLVDPAQGGGRSRRGRHLPARA